MFISTIESGLNHERVDKPLTYYTLKTDVYQLPIWDVNATKSSATEKRRAAETTENQLTGIYGTHINGGLDGNGVVVRNGAFIDASNHPENFLIGILSGTELVINSIYVGDKYNTGKELIFSGLSTVGTNYLWGTLIEQNPLNFDYLSSRQYSDIGARITNTLSPPQDDSVLLGTYVSGVGFSNALANRFVTCKEHVDNSQNPHGPILSQDELVSSGVYVYNNPDRSTKVPYVNLPVLSGTIINYEYLQNVRHQGFGNNIYVEGDLFGTTLSGVGPQVLTSYDLMYGIGYNTDSVDATLTPVGATIVTPQVSNFYFSLFYRSITFYRYPMTGAVARVDSSTGSEDGLSIDVLKVNSDGFDIVGVGNGTSSTASNTVLTKTWSHTVVSGSNRVLFVCVFATTSCTVTFDGLPMTLINSSGVLSGGTRSIFYLIDPPVGTSTVEVTLSLTGDVHGQSVDFYNVNQTTPYSGFANATASATNTISIAEPTGGSTIVNRLNLQNSQVANVGNLAVTSGLDVYSESLFRNSFNLNSGVAIDGLQPSLITPYISNTCVSGYTHIHSPFNIISGECIKLTPKFYGTVTASTKFRNNFDLSPTTFKPTLKHENNFFPEDLWIRTFIPAGCNIVESIYIEHLVNTGCSVDVTLYNCLGAELVPETGNVLRPSASMRTTVVSGIDQDGFTQRQPFDIKLTFNTSGSGVHYIGDITMNFIGNNGN